MNIECEYIYECDDQSTYCLHNNSYVSYEFCLKCEIEEV